MGQSQLDRGVQVADLYRLSVDQYHRMLTPGILLEGDPVELLEGLLLQKWAARTSDGVGSMYVDEFYPLTVEQYHEMARLGILTDDDRVELLEGVLVSKMTKNDPHIEASRRCRRAIEPRLPNGRFYETEQPIVLTRSEPEPDGVVIIGSPFDARLIRPHPSDVELVIEVSERSLSRDRGIKLRSYARAGIACYWIINLIDRQIEVHTHPDTTRPDAKAEVPTYRDRQVFKPGDSVPLVIDGQTIAQIPVADILPTAS